MISAYSKPARNWLKKTGDAMTAGFLTLFQDPTADLHAATKHYVDTHGTGSDPTKWSWDGYQYTAGGAGDFSIGFGIVADAWIAGAAVSGTLTTAVPGNGLLTVWPVLVARSGTLSSIVVEVTAGGTATAKMRFGLYTNAAGKRFPDGLFADLGEFDFSSNGLKTIAVSQALTGGTLYWGAVLGNNGGPNVRAMPVGMTGIAGGFTATAGTLTGVYNQFAKTQAYGALPASFGVADSAANASVPAVYMRFSA